MDTSMGFVMLAAVVVGAALGAAVAWLAAKSRLAGALAEASQQATDLGARLDERAGRAAAVERDLAAARADAERLRAEVAAAREGQARLDAQLAEERRAAAEKLALIDQAQQALRETFQALSSEALRSNNESFLTLARESLAQFQQMAATDLEGRQKAIDEMVKPLRESLQQVDSKLQEVEKARIGAYEGLSQQVKALAETQQQLEGETSNLVRALRTPSIRGHWGEMQLKRVVEMAGMLPHCDFREQPSVTTEDGRLRPDVVVNLPGARFMVVDAKVPLEAYLEALEADEDGGRESFLKDHARQVRDHVTRLSDKAYWAQFQPAPECVVMFLPGEGVFSAAFQHDPTLIEFAAGRRVVLASPMTLIALLYAVAKGWQQERLAENAEQISRLGQDLHDRLRVLAGHFESLRKSLDGATAAYNSAVGSLEARVLVSARRFKDLGAAGQEEIPSLDVVERKPRELQMDQLALLPDAPEDVDPLAMEAGRPTPASAKGS